MSVTIKEIASKAKISTATVSRVINNPDVVSEKTRQRVLSLLKKSNYRQNIFAKNLALGRSNTLALVTSGVKRFYDAYYFKELFLGINEAAVEMNYNILNYIHNGKNDVLYRNRFPVDGYIFMAPPVDDPLIKVMEEEFLSAVLINRRSSKLNWVDIDNVHSAEVVVGHLIRLGHKKICIMAGSEKAQNSIDRIKGYRRALRKNSIPCSSKYVLYGDFSEEKAFILSREFFKKHPEVTAVFACNDLMAIGVINAVKSLEKSVPENISVAGFDDMDLASGHFPSITTYRQPIYRMGKEAVKLLVQSVEDKNYRNKGVLLGGELVIRESTAGVI